MKHIKIFEEYNPIRLPEYNDKIFIDIPSSTYFKSDIKFNLIFVNSVIKSKVYYVRSDAVVQFNEYRDGTENFSYIRWDQEYSEKEFDLINFMTAEEFYHKYKSSYIRILEEVLDKLDQGDKYTEQKLIQLNEISDRLTIPEVEHIIRSRKY